MSRLRRIRLKAAVVLSLFAVPFVVVGGQVVGEARQQKRNRALITAIKQDNTRTALACLEQGADANARDDAQAARAFWQRLWDRLRGKSYPTVYRPPALLLALDFRAVDSDEPSYAPKNPTLIAALIDHGADANVKNNKGMPALYLATWSQDANTLRYMLAHGANPELATPNGLTALHLASSHDRPDLIKALLDGGANINAQDGEGMTPLLWAIHDNNAPANQAKAVTILLVRHPRIDLAARNGDTPLSFAHAFHKPAIVRLLKRPH